jgi:predicted ferric reductase
LVTLPGIEPDRIIHIRESAKFLGNSAPARIEQVGWLSMGKTPFHREEHPISFSSSAEIAPGGELSFTFKALGDWSGKVVREIQPGTRVWLDGPYGVFTPDRQQGPGYVLIGGGIGITPLYSMCLTLADREDLRPVCLFYGRREYGELTFRDELDHHAAHEPEGRFTCWNMLRRIGREQLDSLIRTRCVATC